MYFGANYRQTHINWVSTYDGEVKNLQQGNYLANWEFDWRYNWFRGFKYVYVIILQS